jgi:enediyne biosynthesis protein E2
MPTLLGSLRRFALTPSLAKVSFQGRRFPVTPTEATKRLEAIPQSVICGFEWGIDSRTQWEVERRLSLVEPEMRGFAYEGAAMAYTVRDAMAGGRGHRTRDLLMGPGQPHIFLTYIGIGFAMARLPRVLWKKVMPDLSGSAYYPTMSWFAVDGYGFDRAYFDTKKWVDQQRIPKPYPWAGSPDYFLRAVDHGIGRALWFIHGGQAADVVAAVQRFAAGRQADLWSGVGLAATFAGGCPPEDLAELLAESGDHHAEVSLGAVLAIKARHYSGFMPPHTEAAASVLVNLSVEDAVDLADRTEVDPDSSGPVPPYELWRQRIRAHFTVSAEQVVN